MGDGDITAPATVRLPLCYETVKRLDFIAPDIYQQSYRAFHYFCGQYGEPMVHPVSGRWSEENFVQEEYDRGTTLNFAKRRAVYGNRIRGVQSRALG